MVSISLNWVIQSPPRPITVAKEMQYFLHSGLGYVVSPGVREWYQPHLIRRDRELGKESLPKGNQGVLVSKGGAGHPGRTFKR